jgi:hypothetical protein
MGILDDAIREHLDLKRRLGAAEIELARLEDEAFGPPTRPGDPDFPEEQPAGQAATEPATGEPQPAAATEAPAETGEAVAEAPPEEPSVPQPPVATETPVDAAAISAPDAAPASPPTAEHPPPTAEHPAPTSDAPAVDPAPTPAPAEPPSEEMAATEPATGEFYDQSGGNDLELDLELELDEIELEEEPAEPPSEEAPAVPVTDERPAVEPQPDPPAAPIESLDTVEHHIEGALEDTGDVEVVEGEVAEDAPPAEPAAEDGDAEEDEDVLEETPEFLRDQPEDDELWFEQGEPKDFDF